MELRKLGTVEQEPGAGTREQKKKLENIFWNRNQRKRTKAT